MTSVERTLDFVAGKPVDTPPLHPIIMLFAARYAGIKYRDFCLNAEAKVRGMVKCADDFGLDWVTVMSDPYVEAEAFGLDVEYPEDSLPVQKGHVLNDIKDVQSMRVPDLASSRRMLSRISEVEQYARLYGDKYFIVGWTEGPMAEYADLRGLSGACLDLYDYHSEINSAFDIIMENAFQVSDAQIKVGAHCIGVGDAACSQIGPAMYEEYVFEREKQLVEHIHSRGALVKLHICGNTSSILPKMIATGVDIIDVDHMVGNMAQYVPLLAKNQVISGNSDPVDIVMRGSFETITADVKRCWNETKGRGIVSAGCEVPPDTSIESFKAYCRAARALS